MTSSHAIKLDLIAPGDGTPALYADSVSHAKKVPRALGVRTRAGEAHTHTAVHTHRAAPPLPLELSFGIVRTYQIQRPSFPGGYGGRSSTLLLEGKLGYGAEISLAETLY